MIRNRCNIFWVDAGVHNKNEGKTYASCASRMMQFSLRFWSGYLHQPKKYYNDSLNDRHIGLKIKTWKRMLIDHEYLFLSIFLKIHATVG